MDYDAEGRITECPQYVRVDFGSCNALELSETYRSFADLCIGKQVSRALLKAGDNSPEGHMALRDALMKLALVAAIPYDFKLALVPSTPPIEAVYRDAQQRLRAVGLDAWVFNTEDQALDWLGGGLAGIRTAS
jgi:hypothetical protein